MTSTTVGPPPEARPGSGTASRHRRSGAASWGPWVALAATAAALALGLRRLGFQALSYDEAYTVGLVHGPFAETWQRITTWDTNQAPYYLLFSLWYELGEGEAMMRLLSVLFYVATVPLVYAVGRRLVDARVGALAAVTFTLNGLALEWAQEARSYSMVLFLTALASYLLVRALDATDPLRPGIAYGLVALAGIYAHFLVALVVGAQLASLALLRPRPWRLAAAAGTTIALGCLPALAYVVTLSGDPLNFIEPPSTRELVTILADTAGGGGVQLLVVGGACALAALSALALQRRRPGSALAWGHAMPVLSVVLPLVALVLATYTVKPLLVTRYLIIIVPSLALAAATGAVAAWDRDRRLGAAVAAAVVVASVGGVVIHHRESDRVEWRQGTELAVAAAEPGDAIVPIPGSARPAVAYYQRRLGTDVPLLLPQADDPPTPTRLWVLRQPVPGEMVWDPIPDFEDWRERSYVLVEEQVVGPQLTVELYERRG